MKRRLAPLLLMSGLLIALLSLPVMPLMAADDYAAGIAALESQDYLSAARLFNRMAKRDHVKAQYQLGLLYLSGKGVDADVDKGMEWLKRAAEGGSYKAANELSQIYLSGKGVPRDEQEAVKWLELATQIAQQNTEEADSGCE